MSADRVLHRSPVPAIGGFTLPPWLAVILRKLRQALLSDEERRLLHLVEFAIATLGAPLLEASDLEDLERRLDEQIERPEMNNLLGLMAASFPAVAPETTPAASDVAAATAPLLGEGLQGLLREGFRLSEAIAMAIGRLMRLRGPSELQMAAEQRSADKPLGFLENPRIPPEVAASWLAGLRANVLMFALMYPLIYPQTPEPWLLRSIAEQWIHNQRLYMRFLASIPEAQVPLDIVPAEERMDLEKLFGQTADAARHLEDLARKAIDSGADVFPPRDEPDDA